jgi:hypothetical protein
MSLGRFELEVVLQRYKRYDMFPRDEHESICRQHGWNPNHPNSVYMTRLSWLENDMCFPILHKYGAWCENDIDTCEKEMEITSQYPWMFGGTKETDQLKIRTNITKYEMYIRECLKSLTNEELRMVVPNVSSQMSKIF